MATLIQIGSRALIFWVFSTPSLTQTLDKSSPRISNNNEANYTLSKLNVLSIDADRYITADATSSNGTKALVFITQTSLQLSMRN